MHDSNEVQHLLPNALTSSEEQLKEVTEVRFNSFDDSTVATWLSREHFEGKIAFNTAFGWLVYNGKHWEPTGKHNVIELVRQINEDTVMKAYGERSLDIETLRSLKILLSQTKINKVVELLKGIHDVPAKEFDDKPFLLNVENGIIDLRTGELHPHDWKKLLIRHVSTNYLPHAVHQDWTSALEALPHDEHDWHQRRFGQAITGFPTSDDVLPVMMGHGENGKSTVVVAITSAVGEYSTAISERLLLANPSDHPTELMSLRGVRLGFIEELPEGKVLPVKRLKDVLGTDRLMARLVHKDNVEWETTHSLFVTTNYLPIVQEVDHATWRRLKLVIFPYRFVKGDRTLLADEKRGDSGLRQRLKQSETGQREAVLAWLVEGAVKHLANEDELNNVPDRISFDTADWRKSVDTLHHFLTEQVDFDRSSHVMTTDLHNAYNSWVGNHDGRQVSAVTFTNQMLRHEDILSNGVSKDRISPQSGLSRPFGSAPPTNPYTAWRGIKFKK
jgi:putative DNA primase/helicase